jgi:hypothetical protein
MPKSGIPPVGRVAPRAPRLKPKRSDTGSSRPPLRAAHFDRINKMNRMPKRKTTNQPAALIAGRLVSAPPRVVFWKLAQTDARQSIRTPASWLLKVKSGKLM